MDDTTTLVGSIDQGTQSTRFSLYTLRTQKKVVSAAVKHEQISPRPGWIEHDPIEIMKAVYASMNACGLALLHSNKEFKVACIGVTNQRETIVVWDRYSGQPLCNALVWADERAQAKVDDILKDAGKAKRIKSLTGLPVNCYFSAVKIAWLCEHRPDVAAHVLSGMARIGTIDTWIIWNLTGAGQTGQFVTDVTNASRTQLYNVTSTCWDPELFQLFGLDKKLRKQFPTVKSCAEIFGAVSRAISPALRGEVTSVAVVSYEPQTPSDSIWVESDCPHNLYHDVLISGCLGDQQAACVGQKLFGPSSIKCTFGTGAFLLMNTGERRILSERGLLTAPCYQLGPNAPLVWAIEGAMASAGSVVSWLTDKIGLVSSPEESEAILASTPSSEGVVFVPALTGLYTPYWAPRARALFGGMSNFTEKKHLVRSVFEGIAYNLYEVIETLKADFAVAGSSPAPGAELLHVKVDGGMSINSPFMQICADTTGVTIERPPDLDVTALGAAHTASIGAGLIGFKDLICEGGNLVWEPDATSAERKTGLEAWRKAVASSF